MSQTLFLKKKYILLVCCRYKRKTGGKMEKQSIAELKQLFQTADLSKEFIIDLKKDERKGVQKLIQTYEKQKKKLKEQEQKFIEMSAYEATAYKNGSQYIAGVDEVGRGPLAGPVVAAAVILPHDFKLLGLNDSKQLNEATRNEFYSIIKEQAICYEIAVVDNTTIDKINIYEATKLAMRNTIHQLSIKPDHVLVDAVELDGLSYSSEAIIKGDTRSISIAAASILAKVTRDNLMKEIHKQYPMYNFNANMGYGTKYHMEQLKKYGATTYHRTSFAPVRKVIGKSS